jgi:hypothetical protein
MNAQVKRAVDGTSGRDISRLLEKHVAVAARHGPPWSERVLASSESDASYFQRRAGEERTSAAGAESELTRALHLELAQRYASLSAAIREVEDKIG